MLKKDKRVDHSLLKCCFVEAAGSWILTGRVIVTGDRLIVAVVAVVSKQRLVVVVFVPVERLDFEASPLWVSTHDPGHGLVHLVWRPCGVCSQIEDLLPHVLPTLHAGKLFR